MRLYQTAGGQLVGELRGHSQRVSTLAYNSQGTQVLTGSIDGVARIFEVPSLKLLHTLGGHRGEISDAHFSPKYPHALTASKDGTATLWDTDTGRSLFTWDDVDPRRPLAVFGSDGLSIALAGRKSAGCSRASSTKGREETPETYLATSTVWPWKYAAPPRSTTWFAVVSRCASMAKRSCRLDAMCRLVGACLQ